MPVVVAVVLIGCVALTLFIARARRGTRERDPELEEALERTRAWLRRPAAVIAGAVILGLALIAGLARNPSRWPVLLLGLALLAVGVTAFVVVDRRRRGG